MKIVIKESEWGARWLLNPGTKKKCCLGFACLALGLEERNIVGKGYPSSAGVNDFELEPSEELLNEAKSLGCFTHADHLGLQYIAAHANDQYHDLVDKDQQRARIQIMKKCFEEAGHEFVLDREE